MKKFFNAIIVLIAFHSNSIITQDVEEIVITSSLVDTTEITNPLYVIDGDDILDDATTSLGDAIDTYLGLSLIHILRCRLYSLFRSLWSQNH